MLCHGSATNHFHPTLMIVVADLESRPAASQPARRRGAPMDRSPRLGWNLLDIRRAQGDIHEVAPRTLRWN